MPNILTIVMILIALAGGQLVGQVARDSKLIDCQQAGHGGAICAPKK